MTDRPEAQLSSGDEEGPGRGEGSAKEVTKVEKVSKKVIMLTKVIKKVTRSARGPRALM